MDAVKILEKQSGIDWDYDEEANVLYLSVGAPRPAVGIDVGDGVVLRYHQSSNELVGVTLVGLRSQLERELEGNQNQP